MKSVFKKVLGVILIILGFLALVTPFTPGSWLILVGLELLGLRFLLQGKLRFLSKSKLVARVRTFFKVGQRRRAKGPGSAPPQNGQKSE